MTSFINYLENALKSAIFDEIKHIEYLTLGLSGEVGEIANKMKKVIRGDHKLDEDTKKQIEDEMGDVMWYFAVLLYYLNDQDTIKTSEKFNEILRNNNEKTLSRLARNKIKGSGDNR